MRLFDIFKGLFNPEKREERRAIREAKKAARKAQNEARKAAREAKRNARRARKEDIEPDIQEQVKEAYPQWGPTWESEHEERLKAADQEWRLKQQEESYKKFNQHYGMSRLDYEDMFDDIGGSMEELSMYMDGGSPTVVEMYRYYKQQFKDPDPGAFVNMIKAVREEYPGMNQEDLVSQIYFEIDRTKASERLYG